MNQENHKELLAAVDRFHRRWRQVRTLTGVGRLLLITVVASAICCLIDYYTELNLLARYSLTSCFYTVIGLSALFLIVLPLTKGLPTTKLAWMIEQRHPELRELLASTLTLAAGRRDHLSDDMMDQILFECKEKVCQLKPGKTFPLTLQMFSVELSALALFCIAMSIPPLQFPELLLRVAAPSDYQPGIGAFQLQFRSPETDRMTEGARTTFEITTDNTELQAINLFFRFPDGRLEQETVVRHDEYEPFIFVTDGFYDSVEYWAKAGKVSTSKKLLTIRKRPKIVSFVIRHFPPAHTELPPIDIESTSGDLKALANTTVEMTITATKPLSSMELMLGGDSIPVELSTDRRKGLCRFLVNQSGQYTVHMRDASGLGSPEGMDYTITMIPDIPPKVTIVQPEAEIFTEGSGSIQLNWHARDDFGIAHQEIQCSVLGGTSYTFPLSPDATSFTLELDQLSLVVGDELQITVHALDATRQEGVSSPIPAFILGTSEFNNANRFRTLLANLSADLAESDSRLKEVESSIQEVILAQSTNIKENADLGHNLAMLNHRIERLDRQLLRVISHISGLEDTAFFPYSHQLLRDIDLSIGLQLIFGKYHQKQSTAAVKEGQLECQRVIMRCTHAVQHLQEFANRWIVDTVGRTTLTALRSASMSSCPPTALRTFYNSKLLLCYSILPDPELKSMLIPEETLRLSSKQLAKKLSDYLNQNSKSIQNHSTLQSEVREFKRLPKNLDDRLSRYDKAFAKEDPLDTWSVSKRFGAYLQAPAHESPVKAADSSLLKDILSEARRKRSPELFGLTVQARRRMGYYYTSLLLSERTESFHQYIGSLIDPGKGHENMALSSIKRKNPAYYSRLHDEIEYLGSLPLSAMATDRNRTRFNSVLDQSNFFRTELDNSPKEGAQATTLADVYTFSKNTNDFFRNLVKTDLRWRNLMRKAIEKELPTPSQKFHLLNSRLERVSDALASNNYPAFAELEDIVKDLYNFANALEKGAVADSLRQGSDLSGLELRLGISYSIYGVLSERLTPLLQVLTATEDSLGSPSPNAFRESAGDLQYGLNSLQELARLLTEHEALSYGLRSIDQAHELHVNLRDKTRQVFSPELIGYLSFFDQTSNVSQRLQQVYDGVPDSGLKELSTLALKANQCRAISQESLLMLRSIAPSSLRSVIREHAFQALKGLSDLRQAIEISDSAEQSQTLIAQATFAERNLRFAEDINRLVELPDIGVSINVREGIIAKLSEANSALKPDERNSILNSVDQAIISTKTLADNALFYPKRLSTDSGSSQFVLPEDVRREVLNGLVRIQHLLLFINAHSQIKAGLDAELSSLTATYRRELTKMKRQKRNSPALGTVINELLKNVGKKPAEEQLKELTGLCAHHKLPQAESSKVRAAFPDAMLPVQQKSLEHENMILESRSTVNTLSDSLRSILQPYSGNRGGVLSIQLMDHLGDSIDLSDYEQAGKNLEALINSLFKPVPPPLVSAPPSSAVTVEPIDMDFIAALPANPFSIRAIIEANQENRLPTSVRANVIQLVSQGAYHGARMLLPSDIAEILYSAQEGDALIPKDALPLAFRGDQLEISARKNILPPKHFATLSNTYLIGNRSAVYHYLNGDKDEAFDSLKRFAATLPDEQAVVCNGLITELNSLEDYGHDFNEITGLPAEASEVASLLLDLRITDYVLDLAQVLVAYHENYRALSFLVNHRYREAANAAYGLLELMPGYPSEDLETGLLRLVELDLKRYPSENHLVRKALRDMPYSVPAVTYAVANADLEEAATITARIGMTASSEGFHNAEVYLSESRSPWEEQALSYLKTALNASEGEKDRKILISALNYLKTQQPGRAVNYLEQFIGNASARYHALLSLDESVSARDRQLAAIENAIAAARKGNIPAALYSLPGQPELSEVVHRLKLSARNLRNGMSASLKATADDIPFGIQRSLTAAFDAAANYDLVAAFAAAERAGAHGNRASADFSKARADLQSAISQLERFQVKIMETPLLDEETTFFLTSSISDDIKRQEALYLLEQKDYKAAVAYILADKPAEVAAYEAYRILARPSPPMKAEDMLGMSTGPQQEVKYLLRLLVNLQRVSENPESDQVPSQLRDSIVLSESIMEVLSAKAQRQIQNLQGTKSKELITHSNRFMSAGQRAWLSRLEKESYTDFNGKRMSLGISFLRGEKQNYSSYYREANRHYLNWLLEQSKTTPEETATP